MSQEHRLERAGAALRAAVETMPFPQLRRPTPYHRALMAFSAGLVVAILAIGIPLLLARSPGPAESPLAPANAPSTTATPDTTTSSSASATAAAAYTCGPELPYTVALPEDFAGPASGASPHSPDPVESGQLVLHWTGRDGSVEIRWPTNAEFTDGAEWGANPVWSGPDSEFALFITPAPSNEGRSEKMMMFELLPTDLMSGLCDASQLVVYGPAQLDGARPRRGAGTGTNDDADLIIYPNLPRPRDTQLIMDTVEIDQAPPVVLCTGGEGAGPPNKKMNTPNGPIYDTPAEALEALLAADAAEFWPKTGFFELVASDGSIIYGNPLDDNSLNPRPKNGLVVAVSVIQVDSGWTVDGWETSGC